MRGAQIAWASFFSSTRASTDWQVINATQRWVCIERSFYKYENYCCFIGWSPAMEEIKITVKELLKCVETGDFLKFPRIFCHLANLGTQHKDHMKYIPSGQHQLRMTRIWNDLNLKMVNNFHFIVAFFSLSSLRTRTVGNAPKRTRGGRGGGRAPCKRGKKK